MGGMTSDVRYAYDSMILPEYDYTPDQLAAVERWKVENAETLAAVEQWKIDNAESWARTQEASRIALENGWMRYHVSCDGVVSPR